MSCAFYAILLDALLVPNPPVLHIHFALEICDHEPDWHLFFTQHFVEESVVALCGSGDSVPSDAKEEKIDTSDLAQPPYESVGLLDCWKVAVYPHLGFLQSDCIPDVDMHWVDKKPMLRCSHCAPFGVLGGFRHSTTRDEVDDGTLPYPRLSK